MKKLSDLFKRKAPGGGAHPVEVELRGRLSAFQRLLEHNNVVLAAMADLEEKRTGDYLFDRAYLDSAFGTLSRSVLAMIEELRTLTDDGYPGLFAAHAAIAAGVEAALRGPTFDPEGSLVLRLREITPDREPLAGGKMGHLGRVASEPSVSVPDGFVVTAAAFVRFLDHGGLRERVRSRLAEVGIDDLPELERASAEIRGLIAAAPLPEALAQAIRQAAADLEAAGPGGYAVRSSAVWEDGEYSFAGQYATCLNVSAADLESRYREVVGSLFTPRAIFYYRTHGFSEEQMAMAVGVMRMVDARAAGVLFTRDPLAPARAVMVINAAWGLGTSVVDGSSPADAWVVERVGGAVLERRVGDKAVRAARAETGGVGQEAVADAERHQPSLTDEQAAGLARLGLALEERLGGPQDVEWALDAAGRAWILQSRPLQLVDAPAPPALPRRIANRRVLLDAGVVACQGAGAGPVAIVRSDADAAAFPAGAVLVARTTATGLAALLPRAAALVTDVGSTAGHLASLAREYGVPALLDTACATSVLAPGREVTVDAWHGTVYEGRVEELLSRAPRRRDAHAAASPLAALAAALEFAAPLHLTDPGAESFRPESCQTFHDITRFAHEQAMAAMFALADGRGGGGDEAVALVAGIPVGIHVIDMGGGLASGGHPAGRARRVGPDAVRSVPFAALLAGMRAMRWPEPRAADAGGLLGMMAHTASIPDEELRATAEKSLALVGANYLNFSIRLGYHFSQVEAWVGDQLNDNYIRFFFKGGGAVRDRRLRRVRLIGEILERMDFRVQVADDVVRAVAAKFRRADLERTLEAMGKLTAYTKQLDMAMFNDAVTDWYRDEFVREHLAPRATPEA